MYLKSVGVLRVYGRLNLVQIHASFLEMILQYFASTEIVCGFCKSFLILYEFYTREIGRTGLLFI